MPSKAYLEGPQAHLQNMDVKKWTAQKRMMRNSLKNWEKSSRSFVDAQVIESATDYGEAEINMQSAREWYETQRYILAMRWKRSQLGQVPIRGSGKDMTNILLKKKCSSWIKGLNKTTYLLVREKDQCHISIPVQIQMRGDKLPVKAKGWLNISSHTKSRTGCGKDKGHGGSAYHQKLIQRDHIPAVKGQRPCCGQNTIRRSKKKITHFLWKDEEQGGVRIPSDAHTTRSRTNCGRTKNMVGSENNPMLIQQDHAQTVEGWRTWWGQNTIRCSYKITHCLWKAEEHGGVRIPSDAHTTRSRTSCGRSKNMMGSEYHPMLIQQDHAHTVEGRRTWWG